MPSYYSTIWFRLKISRTAWTGGSNRAWADYPWEAGAGPMKRKAAGFPDAADDAATRPLIATAGDLIKPGARMPIEFRTQHQEGWRIALKEAQVEVLVEPGTLAWSEGPLWLGGALFFTDTIAANIYRLDVDGDCAGTGGGSGGGSGSGSGGSGDGGRRRRLTLWATECGGLSSSEALAANLAEPGSNGMAADVHDPGLVYICQHAKHRLIRCRLGDLTTPGAPLEQAPDFEVICDSDPAGRPLNSPNDCVVASDGAVWFTVRVSLVLWL